MNPAMIQLAIFALSEAIKAYPQLRAEISAVLNKENPTPEDWAALHAKISAKGYFDYVPQSAVPH